MQGYDSKGNYNGKNDAFYDYKGYLRHQGDGFYDAKGNWVNPGGAFYDSKGYLRKPGDGFYDAQGNWVNAVQSIEDSIVQGEQNIVAFGGAILLLLGAVIVGSFTLLTRTIVDHVYLVYIGYTFFALVLAYCQNINKKTTKIWLFSAGISNLICIMSCLYFVLLCAIPQYLNAEKIVEGFINFIIVIFFSFGAVIATQFVYYYFDKPLVEIIICLGVAFLILKVTKQTLFYETFLDLETFYNKNDSLIFRLLFGIFYFA